jgi:hypothetical protein
VETRMRGFGAEVDRVICPSTVTGRSCGVGFAHIGGISQGQLPVYLGFFEFVHNVRKRGTALRPALIELLVTYDPGIQYERIQVMLSGQ